MTIYILVFQIDASASEKYFNMAAIESNIQYVKYGRFYCR